MEKVAKTQLVDVIAGKTQLSKKQASEVIDAMLEVVLEALKEGKSVGLSGLGTLGVTETKERSGVRPGTTERITIPAGKKISFKAASTLKSSL